MARARLTEKQREVYDYIHDFIKENKYPPTIREMQKHFGYNSQNSVVVHLTHLEDKGYVTKSSRKNNSKMRTLRLVDDVIGWYTITADELAVALKKLKRRGYNVKINEAIELIKTLGINIK